jgi:hypothetical protein
MLNSLGETTPEHKHHTTLRLDTFVMNNDSNVRGMSVRTANTGWGWDLRLKGTGSRIPGPGPDKRASSCLLLNVQ